MTKKKQGKRTKGKCSQCQTNKNRLERKREKTTTNDSPKFMSRHSSSINKRNDDDAIHTILHHRREEKRNLYDWTSKTLVRWC